jgi:hypothetical protein
MKPEPRQSSDPVAGLCADCAHARRIESDRRSVFYLCRRSMSDPSFAKYPRLPVLNCPGFEPAVEESIAENPTKSSNP